LLKLLEISGMNIKQEVPPETDTEKSKLKDCKNDITAASDLNSTALKSLVLKSGYFFFCRKRRKSDVYAGQICAVSVSPVVTSAEMHHVVIAGDNRHPG